MKPSDYPLALWPFAASASAVETDHLIIAFTVLTVMLTAPIFVGITWFAIRYRSGKNVGVLHDMKCTGAMHPLSSDVIKVWVLSSSFDCY